MLHMVKLSGCEKTWQLRRKTVCWKFKELISRLMNVESSVLFSTVDIQWLGLGDGWGTSASTPRAKHCGISSNIFAFLLSCPDNWDGRKKLTSVLLCLIFSTFGDLLRLNTYQQKYEDIIGWNNDSLLLFTQSCPTLQLCGLQHTRFPCPSLLLRVCLNSCPLSQWWRPSSVAPFSSCLQSFLASGSFPMNWLFASGGQSIGSSASAPIVRSQKADSSGIPILLFLSGYMQLTMLKH